MAKPKYVRKGFQNVQLPRELCKRLKTLCITPGEPYYSILNRLIKSSQCNAPKSARENAERNDDINGKLLSVSRAAV